MASSQEMPSYPNLNGLSPTQLEVDVVLARLWPVERSELSKLSRANFWMCGLVDRSSA